MNLVFKYILIIYYDCEKVTQLSCMCYSLIMNYLLFGSYQWDSALSQKNIQIIMTAFSLYIGVMCKPFLRGPTTPVCKSDNENLTFTCKDSQVQLLQWETDAFNGNTLVFTANTDNGTKNNISYFTAILTYTTKDNVNNTLQIANLTSTLTVPASRISNETVIICKTRSAGIISKSSFELTTAGIVIQVLNSHCLYSITY